MNYFQKIEDKDTWQKLLNKALFKTFFHSLGWEEFLEKQFQEGKFAWQLFNPLKLKFERYLYKDEILLSLARCKISGREKLVSHPFCEYGGPLPLKPSIDFQAFQKAFLKNFQVDFLIKMHPKALIYFSKPSLPFSVRRNSYLIENLANKTKEELWASLRKTTRQAIKKSKACGLEVREVNDKKELKKFYHLYLKICKRNKILAYPFSFLSYFFNQLNSKIVLAWHKNKIIAGSVFLLQKGFVHYFLNASDRSYKSFFPNHLILWLELVNSLQREYQFFDLGGTREGSSLEIFKSGWGATKYPILELGNQETQEKLRYSSLRRVWGFLPIWAVKTFSPYLLKYKL